MPPSIPMLVYAFVSGASVRDLFLAGVVPAVVFAIGLSLDCVRVGRKHRLRQRRGARLGARDLARRSSPPFRRC